MYVPFGKVAMGEPSDFPTLRTASNCGPSETPSCVVTDTRSVTIPVVSCEDCLKLVCSRSSFSGAKVVPPFEGGVSSKPGSTGFGVSDIPCEGKPDKA